MTVEVVLAGRDPSGLAHLLASLLEANLDRDPRRVRLVRPAVVELDAADAGVVVTVRLRRGRVEVADGPANPGAHLRIRGGSHDLLALSSAPLLLGFPSPFRRSGRQVLGQVAGRRVRIAGMLRHPVALSRFARLLSVAR
jgi:hypothetical protein